LGTPAGNAGSANRLGKPAWIACHFLARALHLPDPRCMRAEMELFKDKIEVSLDGRQVFYLFFGGAVIASLVFVLGVMVGKRVEAQAISVTAPADDPLVALDRLSQTKTEPRSFRSALIDGDEDPRYNVDIALAAESPDEQDRANERAASDASAKVSAAKKVADKLAAKKLAVNKPTAVVEPKLEPAVAAMAVAAKLDKAVDKAVANANKPAAADTPVAKPVAAKQAPASAPADQPVEALEAEAAAEELEDSGPSKFTLQLSSFRDRVEADSFFDKLKAAGYEPYIVEAEVPDKGLWYRVRLGGFPSYDAAVVAKKRFEERQRIIAYVTRIGK
jgi:DedD protein